MAQPPKPSTEQRARANRTKAPKKVASGRFRATSLTNGRLSAGAGDTGFLRTVAWDLETTSLTALMGRILCCSFHDLDTGETWTFRGDDPQFLNPKDIIDDSKLAVVIRDQLEQYDVIIAHNGILFDHKFLKARLLKAGERLPEKRFVVDPRWTISSNFRISGALGKATQYLNLPEQKGGEGWEVWQRAMAGDSEALDLIVKYCEQDCLALADLARTVKPAMQKLEFRG